MNRSRLCVVLMVMLIGAVLSMPVVSTAHPIRVNFNGQNGLFFATSSKILPEGTIVLGGGFVSGTEGDVANDYTSLSVPVTVAYSFNDKVMGSLSLPVTTSYDPDVGTSESGVGDLNITVKHTLQKIVKSEAAAAAGLRLKLPLADDSKGLGTGENDVAAFVSVEQDFGGVNTMMNVEYAVLGGSAENQINYAFGFEIPYSETVDISIELLDQGPFTVSSNLSGDLLMGGVNLDSGNSLNVGFGLGIGLNDTSTDYIIAGNISFVLGGKN